MALWEAVHRSVRWHRPLMVFAGAMVVMAVVSGIGLLADDRILLGEPIWLKPFKFAVSLTIYSVTVAWLVSLLRGGRRLAWWMGTVAVAMAAIEMALIAGQALRGRPSHFNNQTPFDAALFKVMAISIVVLWLAGLVTGIVLLRQRFADRPTRWALRLGMGIALIGMALAFLMPPPTPAQSAQLKRHQAVDMIGAHSVGVPDGGPGMPLTDWSTTGGDLRIPHFVGIHALQALPLFVLLLALLARQFPRLRSETVRTRLTLVAGGGYAGLLALVTWQALRGQSLIHPDSATLTAFAVLVVATLGAAGFSMRDGERLPQLSIMDTAGK